MAAHPERPHAPHPPLRGADAGGPAGAVQDVDAARVGPLFQGSHAAEATDREGAGAVEVLARAFRDNPLNRAAVAGGSGRRLRSNRYGMRAMLAVARDHAVVLATREPHPARGPCPPLAAPTGVLVATPPGGYPLPPPPMRVQLRCAWGQGWRTAKCWARASDALARIHPVEPHAYLSLLGVDPACQGRGIGGALLGAWLEDVDREATPAYLETDREEIVGFYRRVGFEVASETRVLDVRVWCMWRPTRATRVASSGSPGAESAESGWSRNAPRFVTQP